MQENILRESNINKIYLIYTNNGVKMKELVKLRFMDKKECFFSAQLSINYQKPKNKTPAELYVYTSDGVYKTKITILGANMSLRDIVYEVSIPKIWDFTQVRNSSRKYTSLPVSIKFNDGFEITTTTYDLSLGGVSFFSDKQIPGIYKKIPGILTLELPHNLLINFPDCKLITETIFVREKANIEDHYNEIMYAFKFGKLTPDEENVLKNYLIKLN